MRIFSAIAATIAVACISTASQGATYVKHTEINILVTGADGDGRELLPGYNILGAQHPVSCDHDEECLVTIQSMVGVAELAGPWKICTLVDGQPITPRCPNQNPAPYKDGGVGNSLGSVVLKKGRHQIETGVVLPEGESGHLRGWEVHYTLMLDPPHGHDND